MNDRHGHAVGGQLLVELAQRMRDALGEGDTLARFGGDEFVAIPVDLDQAQGCEPALLRLLQAAYPVINVGGAKVFGLKVTAKGVETTTACCSRSAANQPKATELPIPCPLVIFATGLVPRAVTRRGAERGDYLFTELGSPSLSSSGRTGMRF